MGDRKVCRPLRKSRARYERLLLGRNFFDDRFSRCTDIDAGSALALRDTVDDGTRAAIAVEAEPARGVGTAGARRSTALRGGAGVQNGHDRDTNPARCRTSEL